MGNAKSTPAVLIATAYALSHLAISTPINNIARVLNAEGYAVDALFAVAKDPARNQPRGISGAFRNLIPCRLGGRGSIVRYALQLHRSVSQSGAGLVLSVDTYALIGVALGNRWKRVPHVHLSLELLSPQGGTARERLLSSGEKWALGAAQRIVIQDSERLQRLSRGNRFDGKQVIFLPNARIGACAEGSRDLFRSKFGIGAGTRIVLCTGSLIRENLVHRVIESVADWSPECVLVVHGWASDWYATTLRGIAARFPGRVFFSSEIVAQEETDALFSSADIGIVFYAGVNDNFKYVGRAAGKILDFMRCGVPVVVNRETNARQFVEGERAGVSVEQADEVGAALRQVLERYAEYRSNALRAFAKYEFSVSFQPLLQYIAARTATPADGRGSPA